MKARSETSEHSWRGGVFRLVLFAAAIAIAFLVLHRTGALSSAAHVVHLLRGWRGHWWLAPAFVVAYAALATVAFPAGVLTIAGGVLFGLGLGSVLNWLGATLGACGAYALARWVAGTWAERLLARRSDVFQHLRSRQRVFWTVLRLRFIPLVPFNLLNLAGGVARVAFPSYLLATALGIVPGTIIYTYFADALMNGIAGARRHALLNLAVAAALLIALSFVPAAAKRMRGHSVDDQHSG